MMRTDNQGALINELLKLNVYYNVLNIKRSSDEALRLGDIFYRAKDGSSFFCITAYCDSILGSQKRLLFCNWQKGKLGDLVKKGDDVFLFIENQSVRHTL